MEEDESMDFSEALRLMTREHKMLTRAGWNASGQWVGMAQSISATFGYRAAGPDGEGRFETEPFLILKNAQEQMVAWVPSTGDLFAEDWQLYTV